MFIWNGYVQDSLMLYSLKIIKLHNWIINFVSPVEAVPECPFQSAVLRALQEIDGETVETVSDFIFLGSKITADGDCSHEIKRHLLLGRKAVTSLDSILKNRYYFADKGLSNQSYGFSSSHEWM